MSTTTDFEADYAVLTQEAGLLDLSERGKLALSGPEARDFLQGQVTQDLRALKPGRGCYAAFLTAKGKMLGDLRILDAGAPTGELLLDTERVALQALFNMVRRYSIGFQVQLHKRTLECGLLALVGPRSDAVIRGLGGSVPGDDEHDHLETELGAAAAGADAAGVDAAGADAAGERAVRVRAIRTERGLDLLCQATDLERLRGALTGAGAGMVDAQAAECLRIESGRGRYGIDLDDSVIPQEAGLNQRAVSFTKGCYVGQETVARLFYKGKPNRELRGLRSDAPLAVGSELVHGERVVGTVTSAADSPRLGPIALALVRREAPVGSSVRVGGERDATVTALPFD